MLRKAVVSGHFCLDIAPHMTATSPGIDQMPKPGELRVVGPARFSTGGVVANAGLALHRLGTSVTLIGKVGDDQFGAAAMRLLCGVDPSLAEHMVCAPGEGGSYTLVFDSAGEDRRFMHYPGPNDTFRAIDVPDASLVDASLFHFGYPPLMAHMYADGGRETAALLQRAKAAGLKTSLDMAMPDPLGASGRVDWVAFLRNVLPHTDFFMPSWEELLYMIDRERYDSRSEGALATMTTDQLRASASRLMGWGAAVVMIKLGDQGIYVRTSRDETRLRATGSHPLSPAWHDAEVLAPCFEVDVCATTGAGDVTIAGFIAAVLRDASPHEAATMAVAAGAHSVEGLDTLSGLCPYSGIERRVASGWRRKLKAAI